MAPTNATDQELAVVAMGTAVGPKLSDINQLRLADLVPADIEPDGVWAPRDSSKPDEPNLARYYLPILNNGAAFVIANPNDGTPPGAWATIPDYIPWLDLSKNALILVDSVMAETDSTGSYPQFCQAIRDLPRNTFRYSGLTETPRKDMQAYAENWLAHVLGGAGSREGEIATSAEELIPAIPIVIGHAAIPPRDDQFFRYLNRGMFALAITLAGGAAAVGEPVIAAGAGAGIFGLALLMKAVKGILGEQARRAHGQIKFPDPLALDPHRRRGGPRNGL